MEQYIKKSDVAAEIERRIKEISKECEESKTIQFTLIGKINALENLLPFLNTTEVKEVDLEKEIDDAFLENKCNITDNVSLVEFVRIANYFFELGLKAKGE